MLEHMRDNSINIKAAEKLPPEQVQGKIIRGILKQDKNAAEYTEKYAKLVERVKKSKTQEA